MKAARLVLFVFSVVILFTGTSASQSNNDSLKNDVPEFEMKLYYFVFLNAVKNVRVIDSTTTMEIQKGHMANIERMFNEGKLRLAGPFEDGGEMRGILILDVATEEEAYKQINMDPAIINGMLEAVIKKWYGPAGLIVEPQARK